MIKNTFEDQDRDVVAGWWVQTVAPAEGRGGSSWPLARPKHSSHPGDLRAWLRPKTLAGWEPTHSVPDGRGAECDTL